MKINKKLLWMGMLALTLVSILMASQSWADDDDDDEREHRGRKKGQEKSWFVFKKIGVEPVTDQVYLKECGACHFAYQPGLLPSGSWEKIMKGLDDHFGEIATLDPADHQHIAELLKTNAAEFSDAKRSYKIVRSLKGKTPLRISEVSYIIRKHHELSKRVYERKSIRTLGNCSACHKGAAEGAYDDDYVKIPKK